MKRNNFVDDGGSFLHDENFFEVSILTYIKDLYHDEIRNGYLVKADIKKVWNRSLEIWAAVDKICRKHDITYQAAYGTLLGAVRHGGYIPWDEDFDLCMMRPEFNRFADVIDDELAETKTFGIFSKDFSTIKIAHNQTTMVTGEIKNPVFNGLMIDIFALDVIDEGTSESFVAFNALKEVFLATFNYPKIVQHMQNGGYSFNELSFLKSIADIPNEQDRYKFACLYANELFNQSSSVIWINDYFTKAYKYPFRKEWFNETIYLPFETVELPAPKMFDEILTSYYSDWRTPFIDGEHKLGFLHSADIPWREFLQRVDI